MDLIKQAEVAVPALATSLALLVLLLACVVYRRHYRRLADNLRASLYRRELDMQLLEHRFKQQAHLQSNESPWNVCPPSESAHNSIPPPPRQLPLGSVCCGGGVGGLKLCYGGERGEALCYIGGGGGLCVYVIGFVWDVYIFFFPPSPFPSFFLLFPFFPSLVFFLFFYFTMFVFRRMMCTGE